jgi:hypothetical protein
MKKIYTLVTILAASFAANAQANMVTNGDLETWTSTTEPANFSPAPYTADVTQESTIVHGGLYSAKHTAQASTTKIQTEVTGIEEGEEYTISYWYLDNDPNAKTRMWSFWLKEGATPGTYITLADHVNDLRPSTYSTDNANWVEKTVTLTAPIDAIAFRFEARTNAEGTGGGFIYFDDFSIIKINNASVKENNIEGLNIFPNPADEVLNITSNSTADKNVQLFDLTGKKVLDVTTVSTVNVSSLKAGIYVAKINEAGKTATRKVIIK